MYYMNMDLMCMWNIIQVLFKMIENGLSLPPSPSLPFLPSLPPSSAQERRARSLLHPQGYNCPDLTEDRVRVVVFRDDKGVKTPVFDSQVHCEPEEGEKVHSRWCVYSILYLYMYIVCRVEMIPVKLMRIYFNPTYCSVHVCFNPWNQDTRIPH